MYLQHFGLERQPFRLTAESDFLYMSPNHARAKAYMDYSVLRGEGFVVITGEVGAGKTTLLHRLVAGLPEQVTVVRIDNTQLSEVELLVSMLRALDVEADAAAGKPELLARIRAAVAAVVRGGRTVVLAIDEAQSLGYRVLEEIRMLAGLEFGDGPGLTVILLGQPELGQLLDAAGMEQLRQRVRLRFHLRGLTREESRKYIETRLRAAGAADPAAPFDAAIYPLLHEYTGGIPRLINTLCDMALLTACVDDRPRVDEPVLRQAIGELGWTSYDQRRLGTVAADGHTPGATGEALRARDPAAGRTEQLIAAIDRLGAAATRIADALEHPEGALAAPAPPPSRPVQALEREAEDTHGDHGDGHYR